MNIHAIVNSSHANGPGNRTVIWTQGCSKACKNCFNPETWSFQNKTNYSPYELFEIIKSNSPEGLTLTGGDPLEQADELLILLKLLNDFNLPKGIILFTGFTHKEIKEFKNNTTECLKYIDVLIDGKYIENLKIDNSLKGSKNQKFYFFSNKIQKDELYFDQTIEIGFNGNLYVTGFPKINKKILKNFGVLVK